MAVSQPRVERLAAARQAKLIDRYPHWWLFALSLASWAALVFAWQSAVRGLDLTALGALCGRTARQSEPFPLSPASVLMLCAMILPLTIGGAKLAAERSLRFRRQRSIAWYVSGYVSVWIAMAVALAIAANEVLAGLGPTAINGLCVALFLAAAAFRWHSLHRLASATCHDVQPLAPLGARADISCLRYGAHHATACFVTCGLATAAAFLSRYPMAWMTVTAALSYMERYRLPVASTLPSAALVLVALGNLIGF